MAVIDPTSLEVGQRVVFRCQHPTDVTKYEGTIAGISSYSIVSMLETDLVPYYTEVLKMIPTLEPIEKLRFITLEYEQDGIVYRVSRAMEWIDPSSIKLINQYHPFDIRIYDRPISEYSNIIDLLSSHGYICSLVE